MIKFIVKDEEELLKAAGEMIHILVNLKYHTDKWYEQGGWVNRKNKKNWEEKRDEIINRLTKKETNE
jgi:hypothetical protein